MKADDTAWDATRWPLIVSLAVGAAWIAVALRSPVWATLLIWVMLVTAVWALFAAPRDARWLARAPLGLYAGWLTAASFVSVALIGAGYGIGPGATGWAWIALALALAAAVTVQMRLPDTPFYGAAVAWGLAGIAVANAGRDLGLTVAAGLAALRALRPLFAENVELTFLARLQGNDDATMLVSNDDLDAVIRVVERLRDRPAQPEPGR